MKKEKNMIFRSSLFIANNYPTFAHTYICYVHIDTLSATPMIRADFSSCCPTITVWFGSARFSHYFMVIRRMFVLAEDWTETML